MTERDSAFEDRQCKVLEHMRASVAAAIDEAHKTYAENMQAAGCRETPPPRGYFASCVMQLAYCIQCGATVEQFQGGDPKMAWHVISNAVDISNHYWGSNFELVSK